MNTPSELRAVLVDAVGGWEWPQCWDTDGLELAHLTSRGMGGTPDGRRNVLDNVALLCHDHARISDGLTGSGGAAQYAAAHRALFGGDRHLDYGLAGSLAHERADALRKRLKEGSRYFEADPSTVQIAIELKTVMTEHHKAAKNRKRDLEAHHEHVHKYSAQALAGGVLLTNIAKRFDSPTRKEGDITVHQDPREHVEHCLDQLRAVAVRGGPSGSGMDAKAGIVVNMDNIDLAATRYHETAPAPKVGDPMHYDAFIQRLCSEYVSRFA